MLKRSRLFPGRIELDRNSRNLLWWKLKQGQVHLGFSKSPEYRAHPHSTHGLFFLIHGYSVPAATRKEVPSSSRQHIHQAVLLSLLFERGKAMYISIEQKTPCLCLHYSHIGTIPSPSIVERYCSHLLRPIMMTMYSQFFLNVSIFYNRWYLPAENLLYSIFVNMYRKTLIEQKRNKN